MGYDGISLLEVFNLLYLSNDQVDSDKQLGKITMDFDSGSNYIYYQSVIDESKPPLKYGDSIFITDGGPICTHKEVDIQFDLFCGAYKGSIKVDFKPFGNRVWFEERIIRSVDGTGEISSVFGLLSNASVAILEIQLLNISATANVHGVVAARNSKLDQPLCTSMLFRKSPANKIQVGRDGVIPLFKSRVGVPLDSKLYVDISLHIDGEHYIHIVPFVHQTAGRKSEEVADQEKKVKILVKVAWDSKEDSVCSTYDDYDTEDEEEEDTEE